jgi:hypothetical protein
VSGLKVVAWRGGGGHKPIVTNRWMMWDAFGKKKKETSFSQLLREGGHMYKIISSFPI